MTKVIKLTESDLTRIVKRILIEQSAGDTVSTALSGINPVAGAAGRVIPILTNIINGGGAASQKVNQIFTACKGSKYPINQNTNKIADSVYNAVTGLGTNENMVYKALQSIRTADELCGVIKSYQSTYNQDLYAALDGDFDSESEWVQIMRPLRDVVLKSQQSMKQKQSSNSVTGQRPTSKPIPASKSSTKPTQNPVAGQRPTPLKTGQRPTPKPVPGQRPTPKPVPGQRPTTR